MTMTAEEYKKLIDERLANCFSKRGFSFDVLLEAMDYSLMAGGKRIRPMLVLEFSRITGGSIEDTLPVACAIEMMHTYSLIHDDLPCMDNDDLRRGRPTNHKVYGECTATLAGDALQAEAFGTILRCSLDAKRRADCAEILAGAAGVDGICGGQFLDMAGEGRVLSESELDDVNSRKTGAMLVAACQLGVAAAGGSEKQLEAAGHYGAAIGAAFQIRDDILDVTSSNEALGKPVGSDADERKNTYMALYGEEKCDAMIDRLTGFAKTALCAAYEDTAFLCALADSLARRNQ